MKARWIGIAGGLLLVAVMAVIGYGAAQAMGANGGFGPFGTNRSGANQQAPYGHGNMMWGGYGPNGTDAPYGPNGTYGPYGPGGMMGGNGMMGGYGPAQAQQNPSSAAPVTGNAVTIQNFAYQPANLQVKVGTTVTWTNNDTAPHTVTFRDSSLKSSGILRQGDTYSYTFTKAGTFSYYCAVHTYMVGQVTVTQ